MSSNRGPEKGSEALDEWQKNKEVLFDLFIRQNKTLEDVKAIMESEHGFSDTLRGCDYEYKLREEFGYRKNLSAADWSLIGAEIARRKARDKDSVVLLNGSQIRNVDRKIKRALRGSRKRKASRGQATDMAMPHGLTIKTPPLQFSRLRHPPASRGSFWPGQAEQPATLEPPTEPLIDNPGQLANLDLSGDIGSCVRNDDTVKASMLRVQLLRGGSPINQLLAFLQEHQNVINEASLRLFGPCTTTAIFGKMCYEFSNHLVPRRGFQVGSALDWIGSSVDLRFLKTFFSLRALTVQAVWEFLNDAAYRMKHATAFDVLLSIRPSIYHQAPWTTPSPIDVFKDCTKISPSRAATVAKAFPYSQWELGEMLRFGALNGLPTGVIKVLVEAGARLIDRNHRGTGDEFILGPRDRFRGNVYYTSGPPRIDLDVIDATLLEILLEAGAAIDEPQLLIEHDMETLRLGWLGPEYPLYATDFILLSGIRPIRFKRLWSVVSSHSNRQQTTITVPGIFEAVCGGQEHLVSYLNARSEPQDSETRNRVLEVALSEASGRGYTDIVQGLMELGVDPNVRKLPKLDWYKTSWHPIIRAANTGHTNTLRLLVATSKIDLTLTDEVLASKLNFWDLAAMRNPQQFQILQALSTLKLSTATRCEILMEAAANASRRNPPDFGFVDQLLALGLACLDEESAHKERQPILYRALDYRYVNSLDYFVKRDMRLVAELFNEPSTAHLDTLAYHASPLGVLQLLAGNIENFRLCAQQKGGSFLKRLLGRTVCSSWGQGKRLEEDCHHIVAMKWFLDLGISFEFDNIPFVSELLEHDSSDSFIMDMVRKGADPNAPNIHGRTALQQSIVRGRLHLAVALIEKGADVNARAHSNSHTALQWACYGNGPIWFITFLLDNGADVNAPPAPVHGLTALQAACSSEMQLSCISLLLERGAEVDAPPAPKGGLTALQCAALRGHMNVVGLLLDRGADVNALSGYVKISCFQRHGSEHPVLLLNGFVRAIDLAALGPRLDMVHLLVAAGARSIQPGRTGWDGAIDLATSKKPGHFAVASLLREHSKIQSGDVMKREQEWLRANPQDSMHDGRMLPAVFLSFIKRVGGNPEVDPDDYFKTELGLLTESKFERARLAKSVLWDSIAD